MKFAKMKSDGDVDYLLEPNPKTWVKLGKTVLVCCPDCEKHFSLSGHRITRAGHVHPSVVCHECGWHAWLTLEEWGQ